MADKFSRRSTTKELAELQRWIGVDLLWPSLLFIVGGYVAFVIYLALISYKPPSRQFLVAERSLLSSSSEELRRFVRAQQDYRSWLERHGTAGELNLFNSISESLFVAARGKGASWLLAPAKFVILRVSFFLLAAGRLWVFMILLAIYLARDRYKTYENEDDILGQTGNGRLYYTGVKAELRNLTPDGAPDVQVVGLACPPVATEQEVLATPLGEFLEKIGADNETNITLAAILLASDGEVPPFAAPPYRYTAPPSGDTGLYDVSYHILVKAVELANSYRSGQPLPAELRPQDKSSDGLTIGAYIDLLERSMNQTLPQSLRSAIAELPVEMLTTGILSFQAGKVLAYADEGGRWIEKTNFPQLSARAVLHSIPAFAREYGFHERKTIRRALIYSSRSSVFGPVRFATDLSDQSRALRQWIELLLEPPAGLVSATYSVELFALIHELHELWKIAFSNAAQHLDELYPNKIHATESGLLLLPLPIIMEIARKVIPAESFRRLGQLVQIVHEHQVQREIREEELGESIKAGVPEYEKVFAPFSKDERKNLSELHGLDERDLKAWSPFRCVLYTFGWLGRRVGDYTVPESSIIFAILYGATSEAEKNALGLVGLNAIVPLRGVRIEERVGKNWSDEFNSVKRANMAETKEQYENLLRGIEDDLQDDIQMAFR